MIRFNIKNNKLIIDPYTLTVGAFNDIWEHDTSQKKATASNILLYVFHLCDITQDNPLLDVPEDQKDSLSRRNAFGNAEYKFSEKEQELIDNAILWYNTTNNDSVLRMSIAMNYQIDNCTEFLMTNKISNANDLKDSLENMKKIKDVLLSKKQTDEFVKKQFEKTKVKGGMERSALEQGLIAYKQKN